MNTMKFEGHSDDTFGEYGVTNIDFDNCASGNPIQFLLEAPDGNRLVVTGIYTHTGVWSIGICTEEDMALPDWPMRWGANGYTTTLEIDVPAGTKLACITEK